MHHLWVDIATSLLLLFTGCLAFLVMLRKIRSLHSNLSPGPHLDDLSIIALVTTLIAILQPFTALYILLVSLLLVSMLLLWLDAVLVYLFGFEVNIHNIRIFLQGADSFSGDSSELTKTFTKRSWVLTPPLAAVCLWAVSIFLVSGNTSFIYWSIATLAVLFLMGVTKSRFNLPFIPVIALLIYGISWSLHEVSLLISHWAFLSSATSLFILVTLALLVVIKPYFETAFFSVRSPLRDFLRGCRMKPHPSVQISQTDQSTHVQLPQAVPQPSDAFGLCQNANIILITMESMARDCIAPHQPDGASLRYLNQLAQQGLVSERHYACCPNTNAAIQHLYQANYPVNDRYPFLKALKTRGYSTTYMMISNTRYFRLRDILDQAGFDHILDRDSEQLNPERGDYSFIDQVDRLNSTLGDGPFFLHIKNEQTHSPYQVVNKEKFSRHNNNTRLGRFGNALEEADSVIQRLIEELAKRRNLNNTIIVYTGDHGQSFGELGYTSHSSSTVKQQVRVPFVMSHPALPPVTLERSNHFDVLPTLMDLLGIEVDTPIFGQSLMHGADNRPLLLHSKTRKGNAPSNSCFLHHNDKTMIDLIYGYRYRLDEEDNLDRELSPKETAYYETLLYAALDNRGLIDDSIFMPRPRTHN